MDRVARLIVFCLVALSCSSAWSFDRVFEQEQVVWTCRGLGAGVGRGMGQQGACQDLISQQPAKTPGGYGAETAHSYVFNSCTTGPGYEQSCYFTDNWTCLFTDGTPGNCGKGSSAIVLNASGVKDTACPQGSIDKGGHPKLCVCGNGFMPSADGKQCRQYTCPPSGSYSAITQPDQKVPNAGDNMCTGGCTYKPSSWKVGQDGQIWATWPFKSTGGFCGGDPKADAPGADSGEKNSQNPAPIPCGANQCPGTVNGTSVCVACKGQSDAGSSSAASAPAGSASGAGDTTTTKQTTCDGVSCTTTTTTKDGNGSVIGQTKEEKPQESFCRENPESPLCKKSSFGGACAATSCDGDAVQCAIAADQYKRNCQWFDDARLGSMEEAGNAVMTGTAHPDGHPLNTATEQSVSFSTVIDQTDRLGASCPQDVSVTVMGKSVSMPLSKACEPLQMVGQLAVAVCMLAAAFIVFKG